MALFQTFISLSPAAAAYFRAPAPLLENRLRLFLVGEGAALVLVTFGFYGLSGASIVGRLPLLRFGLVAVSALYLLRGLFLILNVAIALSTEAAVLVQALVADLVFLTAGITYAIGTGLNWKDLKGDR